MIFSCLYTQITKVNEDDFAPSCTTTILLYPKRNCMAHGLVSLCCLWDTMTFLLGLEDGCFWQTGVAKNFRQCTKKGPALLYCKTFFFCIFLSLHLSLYRRFLQYYTYTMNTAFLHCYSVVRDAGQSRVPTVSHHIANNSVKI